MSRALQRLSWVAGGALALALVVGVTVLMLINLERYKRRVNEDASNALGMEVHVAGRLTTGLFPSFHVTVNDGRVVNRHGALVGSVWRAILSIRPFSLLVGGVRLNRIELVEPTLVLERDPEGKFNTARIANATELLRAFDGGTVEVSRGHLTYADRRAGTGFEARDISIRASHVRLGGGEHPGL